MLEAGAALVVALAVVPHHGPSAAPDASFKFRPAAPRVGQRVKFIASRTRCGSCRFRWHVVNRKHRVLHKLGRGRVLRRTFKTRGMRIVRLTVIGRGGAKARRYKRVRVKRARRRDDPNAVAAPGGPGAGQPGIPPLAQPACLAGAVPVTAAAQLGAVLRAGHDACVTEAVGDVNLGDVHGSPVRHIGTSPSGSFGGIELDGASGLTISARLRSISIRRAARITIEQSIVGGTSASRVADQLIFLPDGADDVTIRDSDIGWTTADNSGNTGYGIRAYEGADRLRIERNRIHHIGADGIQLATTGADGVIDRNEFAYVAPPASSSEHSDDIQVVTNGPNLRITNNYLHHNGVWSEGGPLIGGSGPYIHAGTENSLVFENNLVRDEQNFMQVGNLGTGGCSRSNLVFRRNTFFHNGLLWGSSPDLQWRLCGGANNLYERNVVNDSFGNEFGFAAGGTTARDNLHGGAYSIDAAGTCTVPACNPGGQEPIGIRKPSGVHW